MQIAQTFQSFIVLVQSDNERVGAIASNERIPGNVDRMEYIIRL